MANTEIIFMIHILNDAVGVFTVSYNYWFPYLKSGVFRGYKITDKGIPIDQVRKGVNEDF